MVSSLTEVSFKFFTHLPGAFSLYVLSSCVLPLHVLYYQNPQTVWVQEEESNF